MTNDITGRYRMTRQNIERQSLQCHHLQLGKWPITKIMSGVNQFNPDRAGIDALVSTPIRDAGVSYWRGHKSINARSIGIELVNPGHDFGYRPFPELQMMALETLALDILARHSIPPRNVVGHSDIAPTRKNDPGELFDWRSLAAKGIGMWPERAANGPCNVMDALETVGYETLDYARALAAFQRHFRPVEIQGVSDPDTLCWLQGTVELVEKMG